MQNYDLTPAFADDAEPAMSASPPRRRAQPRHGFDRPATTGGTCAAGAHGDGARAPRERDGCGQTAFREALFLGLQDGDRRPRTRDRGADRLRLSNLPRHVVCRHPYMPAPPPIMSTREQADETPPAMSRIAIIGKHARKQWEWLLYRARLKLGLKLGLNPQLVSILPRHVWANCGTCAIVHHKVRVRLTSPHHNTGF